VALSVLIVDDDPGFLGLTARLLVELGVEDVWTAADATKALAAVQQARPSVVVVDIGLPDRDGIELAYELSELPWGPRIVLTSSDSEAMLALDPDLGQPVLQFIPKEELASDTLERALLHG
jgi:CheY-like chemotaxis protein